MAAGAQILQFRGRAIPPRADSRVSSALAAPFTAAPDTQRMDPETSVALLERVRAGDRDALDALLQRYVPALRRWARGRLPRWARDLADTEDLVQDTVIRTLRNLPTFEHRHDSALQAYLREAVLNRIRDECRRVGRRPGVDGIDDQLPDPGVSPLEAAIGARALARYETALQQLKPEEREVIVARIEMGYSYAEIAEILGKPSPGAARVAASRALLRLAELLRNGA
jgi:RNA polymerase sigma factor (sigma-70 family)